ncbi:MAG: MEMO1 family protein [Euryarchaeota archaeon]|nr:MEMO1 family protein [Euryarchaeota archaeon]
MQTRDLVRKAAVAGQFYPGAKGSLQQQIKDCFHDPRGPGLIPSIKQGKTTVKGLVVPHAGYIYSGAIAAHAYAFLAENGFADIFIILGPNHTGIGSGVSVMTEGAFETPLGRVPINTEYAKQLNRDIIDNDKSAHLHEHSIEVQLPFLQVLAQSKPFDFIPICMALQDYDTALEVGTIIAQIISQSKKNIVIIASSDFSHVGFNYMSMPPQGLRVDAYAEKQDKFALEQIINLNPDGLIRTIYDHTISMCGYGPVAAMLVAAKQLGAKTAKLLKYGTSYEVHPGDSCVGYGSVVVY